MIFSRLFPTDQSAGWGCSHSPCGLPALLHVEMASLDAVVVGEVQPLGQVLFKVGPHFLFRGPALQPTRGAGGGGGGVTGGGVEEGRDCLT